MDVNAAIDYLNRLFGHSSGHVAVAYKDPQDSWQESQFSWPKDKRKLIGWVRVHQDANIFICPALRNDAHTRKKGDGVALRWLWADVDWEKVPTARKDLVRKRIEQMGSYVVGSGTGDNVHVYVDLGQEVSIEEFTRLNTGLRDYLYADNKQADNSLLRLPGMTNWKTPQGSAVRVVGGHSRRRRPAALLKLRAFQKAKGFSADIDSYTWDRVDVSEVPGRLRRLVRMDSDEAVGRYGSRHKAVWAVAGELHKGGLNEDQIHTLMDRFPPAEDKCDDEHGAYDVHKDVARRLQYARGQELDMEEEDTPAFQELTDEEGKALALDEMVEKILARREAMRIADRLEAERGFSAPPPETSWDLSEVLSRPAEPMPYLIGPRVTGELGLAGAKHNVIITAQYKTGKTTFLVGSLIQSLADGQPFLGQFPVPEAGVVVGHWNCEMESQELIDQYIRPVGITNVDNLKGLNLRGYGVNILTPVGKAWTVAWLKDRKVKVWTIDSLARLARMAGVSEKDNEEMLNLLMAVDEINAEAGVDVCFIIAHTGRMQQEEGSERARGATVIDDWPDARWVMTRDGETRFLAVEGRGVRLSTTALVFDPVTMRSVLGIGDKADVRIVGGVQAVMSVVEEHPGIRKRALEEQVKKLMKCGVGAAREFIDEAVEGQFIGKPRRDSGQRGGRPSFIYYPNEKPDLGRGGNGTATPRVMNLRKG